jgi:hypothetical protein
MKGKKSVDQTTRRGRLFPQRKLAEVWPAFAAGALALVIAVGILLLARQRSSLFRPSAEGAGRQEQAQPPPARRAMSPEPRGRAAEDTAWDPAWPPLPDAGTPAKPLEQVRAMYAFAARRPEVLQHAPCYCGCESGGHESVRDCFVKGRTADGRPQWDGMGFI